MYGLSITVAIANNEAFAVANWSIPVAVYNKKLYDNVATLAWVVWSQIDILNLGFLQMKWNRRVYLSAIVLVHMRTHWHAEFQSVKHLNAYKVPLTTHIHTYLYSAHSTGLLRPLPFLLLLPTVVARAAGAAVVWSGYQTHPCVPVTVQGWTDIAEIHGNCTISIGADEGRFGDAQFHEDFIMSNTDLL